MGRVAGDKSRFHRKRRKHIARRAEMRALAKTLREQAGDTPAAESHARTAPPAES